MMSSLVRHLARVASIAGLATALTLVAASVAIAQKGGNIRGTVTNAQTHAPILGARVAIANPERVAITDDHGTYVLRELPAGTYVVMTSAIGRKPDSSSVSVSAGSTVTRDVVMKEGSLLLSSVIVSATRSPVEASKVASTVNVLTPEQVRQSPARESQDLLREISAVELPRTSSLVGGTAQIVSIRGVDEGRTAVLFDGIPVNDAWGEWIDWGRIPKVMLDRVEVVEGGTSSLYGNGAMGGAISFFSRPLSPGAMTMTLDGGSRDARHGAISAGVPIYGALSANVVGDYQQGGGYNLIDPAKAGAVDVVSQVIQRNAYLRLNYAPSANWSAFVTGHEFGDSRNTGTPLSFANRDQQNFDLGLNYGAYTTGFLSLRAFDGRQTEAQRSTAIRAGGRAAEDSSLTATIPSHDWGGSAQWTRSNTWMLESFSVGGDFRHYQGDFNEVDFNTTCPGVNCGKLARTVSSGGSQNLSGAFIQAIAAPIAPLRIELSARVDRWDNNNGHSLDVTPTATSNVTNTKSYGDSSKTAFSPRVGLRYQLFSSLSLHAAYYRAFRAPNLAELYRKQVSSTSITIPNPYLAAENAEGREAGFDWQPIDWIQFKGTWYVADYNNFNVPTNLTATSTPPRPADCGTVTTCRTRLNVNKSRSEGGEAYVAVHPIQQLFLSGSVNYDDDRQQSGLPAGTTDNTKPHINRVPSPKQTLRGTYSSAMFGDWTALYRHEGHTTTLQGVWLDPFTVVDANVQREIVPGVRGFVSVENIGDKKYQINLSAAGPAGIASIGMPRTVRVGVEAYRY
ncbi:MAG: TonB-dependent receptor [Gemmatimonadetes bacterium]|nr:TonB-dependent receptor [Gemmatimonadota bacterium]